MRRIALSLLAAIALGSACGGPSELADAPPTAQEVAIAFPGSEGTASGGGLSSSSYALLGTTSEYYQLTYGISVVVNGTTLELIALLHAIVSITPTTETTTSATWGPYTPGGLDPLTYRVQVVKTAPQHYTFSIDGRPRASASDGDFLPLIDGEITRIKAGIGKGTMSVHFDNRRLLRSDACEQGTISFAFDNTGSPATNDVTFAQFANSNATNKVCLGETPHDATYHYSQTSDGAGDFVFSVQANANAPIENKPALETIEMRSRWQSVGAGRSDVKISGGDVAAELLAGGFSDTYVSASQCWGNSFATVYETSSPAALNLVATDGDASSCAFTSAMLP